MAPQVSNGNIVRKNNLDIQQILNSLQNTSLSPRDVQPLVTSLAEHLRNEHTIPNSTIITSAINISKMHGEKKVYHEAITCLYIISDKQKENLKKDEQNEIANFCSLGLEMYHKEEKIVKLILCIIESLKEYEVDPLTSASCLLKLLYKFDDETMDRSCLNIISTLTSTMPLPDLVRFTETSGCLHKLFFQVIALCDNPFSTQDQPDFSIITVFGHLSRTDKIKITMLQNADYLNRFENVMLTYSQNITVVKNVVEIFINILSRPRYQKGIAVKFSPQFIEQLRYMLYSKNFDLSYHAISCIITILCSKNIRKDPKETHPISNDLRHDTWQIMMKWLDVQIEKLHPLHTLSYLCDVILLEDKLCLTYVMWTLNAEFKKSNNLCMILKGLGEEDHLETFLQVSNKNSLECVRVFATEILQELKKIDNDIANLPSPEDIMNNLHQQYIQPEYIQQQIHMLRLHAENSSEMDIKIILKIKEIIEKDFLWNGIMRECIAFIIAIAKHNIDLSIKTKALEAAIYYLNEHSPISIKRFSLDLKLMCVFYSYVEQIPLSYNISRTIDFVIANIAEFKVSSRRICFAIFSKIKKELMNNWSLYKSLLKYDMSHVSDTSLYQLVECNEPDLCLFVNAIYYIRYTRKVEDGSKYKIKFLFELLKRAISCEKCKRNVTKFLVYFACEVNSLPEYQSGNLMPKELLSFIEMLLKDESVDKNFYLIASLVNATYKTKVEIDVPDNIEEIIKDLNWQDVDLTVVHGVYGSEEELLWNILSSVKSYCRLFAIWVLYNLCGHYKLTMEGECYKDEIREALTDWDSYKESNKPVLSFYGAFEIKFLTARRRILTFFFDEL